MLDYTLSANEQLIKYLEINLVKQFRKFGSNSFICEETKNKIFIYINKSNVLIVHDGIFVLHGSEMLDLIDFRNISKSENEILESYNQMYLKKIIGLVN